MTILKPGLFQMPDECLTLEQKINFYKFWKDQWDWNGNEMNQKLDKSGKSIRTFLIGKKLISAETESNNYVGDTFDSRLQYLNKKLENASKNCINKSSKDITDKDKIELFEAFIAIQLWGGSEGRHVIVNNFENENMDKKWIEIYFDPYSSIIKKLKTIETFKLENINDEYVKFLNFKISFISKHLHFWSIQEKIQNKLPIYDSMVYDILYAANSKQGQRNEHYDKYCDSLNKLSEELKCGLSNMDIEKAIFSYSKKIGVKKDNIVPQRFQNQVETIIVNDFLNSRINLKKVKKRKPTSIQNKYEGLKNGKSQNILIVDGKSGEKYEISQILNKWYCTCPSFKFRKVCKHIIAIKASAN